MKMAGYIGKPFESINPNYRYISYADKLTILGNQQGKCKLCGKEFAYNIRRRLVRGTGEIIEWKKYVLLDVEFHHIITLEPYNSKLHTFENVEALHPDCHKKIHKTTKCK